MSDKGLSENESEFIYRVLEKTFPLLVGQGLTGKNLKTATKSIVAALSESITSLRTGSTK